MDDCFCFFFYDERMLAASALSHVEMRAAAAAAAATYGIRASDSLLRACMHDASHPSMRRAICQRAFPFPFDLYFHYAGSSLMRVGADEYFSRNGVCLCVGMV